MGLPINVYRHGKYDCTNGGVSSKFSELTVINVDGPFEPTEDAPAVMLVKNPFNSVVIKPVDLIDNPKCVVMFGGNYAATCDSRFGEAIQKMTGNRFYGAVPIHDRAEY